MRIPVSLDATAAAALRRIGKTEDVKWSPSGRQLALVGLLSHRLLVLDVEASGDPLRIDVSGGLELTSPSFKHPHGMCWLDERTLVVANRDDEVGILELPEPRPASGVLALAPIRTFGADRRDMVHHPGSVSANHIGLGLVEILVCSNLVDHVSRHVIDLRDACAVRASESLICAGLQIPDGVAYSRSGRWIAVSNHVDHAVVLYRNDDRLNDAGAPQGALRGASHPHGLAFTPDEKWLLVAGGGGPFVHLFRSDDGNWEGERAPAASIQVLSDADYHRGRFHPTEGGPKGLDLIADGTILATTCEEDPLAFFDMRPMLGNVTADPDPADDAAQAERVRACVLGYLDSARSRVDEQTAAIRRISQREVDLIVASRWWRVVLPVRRVARALLYSGFRARHWLSRRV